jgi:hypothetical protein
LLLALVEPETLLRCVLASAGGGADRKKNTGK